MHTLTIWPASLTVNTYCDQVGRGYVECQGALIKSGVRIPGASVAQISVGFRV